MGQVTGRRPQQQAQHKTVALHCGEVLEPHHFLHNLIFLSANGDDIMVRQDNTQGNGNVRDISRLAFKI
jgi:hypothetical protein